MTNFNSTTKYNTKKILAGCLALTLLSGSNALAVSQLNFNKNKLKANATYKNVKSIDHLFAPKELNEDLDFMLKTLEEVHPNLYYAVDKVAINKEFEEIKKSFTQPMSSIEFYKKVAPVIAKFNDGHTNLNIPYENIASHFTAGEKLFPYDVRVQDGKIIVVKGIVEKTPIPDNAEIISINGIPAKKIINDGVKYLSGEMTNFREKRLQGSFFYMFWILYGNCKSCDIKYKLPSDDNIIKTDKIQGVSYDECKLYVKNKQMSEDKSNNQSNKDYIYNYIKDIDTGVIDFRSFRNVDAFEVFLNSTFKEMNEKKAKNLIIDIRNNGGGNSVLGDLLTCYITDKNYNMYSRLDMKVSKQIIQHIKNSFDDNNKKNSFKVSADGNSAVATYGDYVETYKAGEIKVYKEKESRPFSIEKQFNGNIYLLTSSKTFSSATDLAAVIKDYKLGTIIGEETGGLATSYGDVYSFNLKNLNLGVGVSYKYFVRPNGKDDGRGVLPDYEVHQTSDDSKKGIDTVMEYTKKLIKESQNK